MSRFDPKPSTDDAVGLSTSTAAPAATGRRGVSIQKPGWLMIGSGIMLTFIYRRLQ